MSFRARAFATRASTTDAVRKLPVGVLLVALIASTFLVPTAASAAGVPRCGVPGQITPHPVNWYSIKVPAFPTGPQSMSDYAVEPLAANRLFVTNGAVVLRSTDSGCTWSSSYELPASGTGMSQANARIVEIAVGSPGTIYLPIQQTEPQPRPRVVVSRDGGASWSEGDGPLLPALVGTIRDFDASLGNGNAAAMLLDMDVSEPGAAGVQGQQLVLRTTTAGQTWDAPGLPEGDIDIVTSVASVPVLTGPRMDQIAINPSRPNEIWLFGEEGIFFLNEGGRTRVTNTATRVLDLSLDGRALVTYGSGPEGKASLDNGESFLEFATGRTVQSADSIFTTYLEVATGSEGHVLYQYLFPGRNKPLIIDTSPVDGRPITDVQLAFPEATSRPSVLGRTMNTIEVLYEPTGRPIDVDIPQIDLEAPPALSDPNQLIPSHKRLVMGIGDQKTIPYRLNLPAATTPLDVYFLIDISGSMQGTIDGIKTGMQEIIDRLSEQRIDVHFGVGSFRSYTDEPAYDRVRQIGPVGADLAAALNSLRARGGGAETQMAALLQSVTGDGDQVIPEGLNMHFRPGSLRVAIEVTDEPISKGGNHPPIQEVTDALLEADVKQVALAIQPAPLLGDHDYERPGQPASDLMTVATGSRAVVPPGASVDCDGDATPELDQGDPIVCMIDPARASDSALMADAIVNVLNAIEDVRSLDVLASPATDTTADSPVIESIEPAVLPEIDLKEPNQLEFEVTARCPYVTRRTTFPVRVAVQRSTTALGEATLEVTCVPPPSPSEPEPVVFAAFVPIAAVPPPPPRPPDPIPEPNPNPNPQPQQNPQAQAGFAAQEQQQPQVALAGQESGAHQPAKEGATTDEYMYSRRESRIPPVGFIFAAAAISSVYGYVLVSRTRTRTAHVQNRRSRRG